jgi:hypothetical protein
MPVKTRHPNDYGALATMKQDEVLHLNNGQTGESGGMLPQTNPNIFVRAALELFDRQLLKSNMPQMKAVTDSAYST